MKFSIITWDASFRESYHTIDSFGNQDYDHNQYEFFWCEFYSNDSDKLLSKLKKYPNFHLINLNRPKTEKWHLGKTLNAGLKRAKGEILIIPDGDIIVPKNFLKEVEKIFEESNKNLVVYFRRWDEPKQAHSDKSYDIDYLKKVAKLNNLTNYGGCMAIRHDVFAEIGFYEEHEIFSGPGANGYEQYLRLRNKGLQIMWSDIPIYHPYHPNTGSSDKINYKLKIAARYHKWINPYNGLEQSWVLFKRDKNLDWKANDGSIDRYLKELKPIDHFIPKEAYCKHKILYCLKNLLKKILYVPKTIFKKIHS